MGQRACLCRVQVVWGWDVKVCASLKSGRSECGRKVANNGTMPEERGTHRRAGQIQIANSKIVVTLATPLKDGSVNPSADVSPHGVIAIMSPTGAPTGFLNAEELTAFRTALSSSLLFTRRQTFKSLVVFGAGRQAYWHIRLALMLRGKPLKTIYIVNRTFSDRTAELLKTFLGMDKETKEREGWTNVKFSVLTPGYRDYVRMVKEYLRGADCVVTTVPSTTPLFDPSILTSTEGRKKGRLFIAIGSYKPHMIELPVELVQQAVKPLGDHRHFHKHAEEGGVVIVDTLTDRKSVV